VALSGHLPGDLSNETVLEVLQLTGHSFSGTLPLSLTSCRSLTTIDLHSNKLTGSLPTNLGNLNNLAYLSLADNQLHGSLPRSLQQMTELRTLGLAKNKLTGSIGVLQHLPFPAPGIIFLRKNLFTGEIPPLSNTISVLDLDCNHFSAIHPDLCNNTMHISAATNPGGCLQDYPKQDLFTCCVNQKQGGLATDLQTSCPALKNCFLPGCTGKSSTLKPSECNA
jgi:hypothetical protein